MIFIALTDDVPAFEPAAAIMRDQHAVHDLQKNGKIAVSEEYEVLGNWKIVWENNRECYHCAANHPEYIRANYDLATMYHRQDDGSYKRDVMTGFNKTKEVDEHTAECIKRWAEEGVIPVEAVTTNFTWPADGWYRCNRQVMRKGWLSESLDGQLASKKLLGHLKTPDAGTLRTVTYPNFWQHMSCDHGVTTRLAPGPHPGSTLIKVYWLVHKDAQEGVDYELDKLMPFWQRTSEQDWDICEWNQKGVESPAYEGGPLSYAREFNLTTFQDWYLKKVSS